MAAWAGVTFWASGASKSAICWLQVSMSASRLLRRLWRRPAIGFARRNSQPEFGRSARGAIGQSEILGDADTAALFTGISRGIDHQLWLVESHVGPK